jgi:CubicO group peptidase (beta-lactamase class C family)
MTKEGGIAVMPDKLQAVLDETVATGAAPFVIAMTGNADGVTWSGTAGNCAPGKPARLDTLFGLYSMTKAVCATAAMILIDRGQLDLDTPAADILPEIGALRVFEGFDGDAPRLRAPKTPITIRHLATHTSGLVYELFSPDLRRYLEVSGTPSYFSWKRAGLNHPLLFDPGEGWGYGTGLDWLGLIIEQIDGRRIDAFCQDEIFTPLGMTDTCFEIDDARLKRLARVYTRTGEDSFADHDGRERQTGGIPSGNEAEKDYYGMGGCLYGTVPDYLRLLRMHLRGGELDGVRLISEPLLRRLKQNIVGDIAVDFDWFPGPRKGHAFAYMRVEDDTPGMRAAGSCFWAGGANSHYWVDFENDLVAVFATYDAPFLDPPFMARFAEFEGAVYAQRQR